MGSEQGHGGLSLERKFPAPGAMAGDGDDDDFFASLGIISVPKDEPVRPSSSCGRPSTGGGAGAGAPASSWGFADGGEVDNAAQLFAPLPLLWHEIRSSLRPAEVDEVAAVIGSDLIDRNEVQGCKHGRPRCAC